MAILVRTELQETQPHSVTFKVSRAAQVELLALEEMRLMVVLVQQEILALKEIQVTQELMVLLDQVVLLEALVIQELKAAQVIQEQMV